MNSISVLRKIAVVLVAVMLFALLPACKSDTSGLSFQQGTIFSKHIRAFMMDIFVRSLHVIRAN